MSPSSPPRSKVFVSYSHQDREYLERLQVHLKPMVRDGSVDPWDDTRILPGQRWENEIQKALEEARVAVLLVSADFLASDFIHEHELPKLLSAEEKDGLVIIPVIVGHCGFRESALSCFQAVNGPEQPLETLDKGEREAVWNRTAQAIRARLGPP